MPHVLEYVLVTILARPLKAAISLVENNLEYTRNIQVISKEYMKYLPRRRLPKINSRLRIVRIEL